MGKVFLKKNKKSFIRLDSTQVIVIGFFLIILIGGILLSLPISSNSGTPTPFLPSLFTSTSATCVTGLVVFDTEVHWSFFGQIVILVLIQTGGLGFMTIATLFSLMFRRNISLKEKMVVLQSLNLSDYKGLSDIVKHVLKGTFAFEGCGALILSLRFIHDFGVVGGIYRGIFTSVSAFCNAGFDLMGRISPFCSLENYTDDIVVNITVTLLIIIGGLGFLVWEEVLTVRKFSRYSLFSKMVLVGTGLLIVTGAALVFFFESGNPETLGGMSLKGQVLGSYFQSVSFRTAGFSTFNLVGLRECTIVIGVVWMFIGGASGSTAGGVKISTMGLLIFTFFNVMRGRKEVVVGHKKISMDTVLRAFTLVFFSILLILVISLTISTVEGKPYLPVLFESVSAFATVGLSMGLTPSLSSPSLLLLMILMFLGRVGFLTITYALFVKMQAESNIISYPEGKLFIG